MPKENIHDLKHMVGLRSAHQIWATGGLHFPSHVAPQHWRCVEPDDGSRPCWSAARLETLRSPGSSWRYSLFPLHAKPHVRLFSLSGSVVSSKSNVSSIARITEDTLQLETSLQNIGGDLRKALASP